MHTNALSQNKITAKFHSLETINGPSGDHVKVSIKTDGRIKSITYNQQTQSKLYALFSKALKGELYNVNIGLMKDGKIEAYRLHFNKMFKSSADIEHSLAYFFGRIQSLAPNAVLTFKSKAVLGETKLGSMYPCNYILV